MPRPPTRCGKAVCFTLDFDAASLLYAMAPSAKRIGVLVSELVRKEVEKRAERPQMLAALAALQSHEGEE